MSLANWAETQLLDWMFHPASTPQRPTGIWVALHNDDPGEDMTNAEVTTAEDANYVRKAVSFDPAEYGAIVSNTVVSWLVDTNSSGYVVSHISLWDAATGGNPLMYGALAVARNLSADGILTFNAGDIVASLD